MRFAPAARLVRLAVPAMLALVAGCGGVGCFPEGGREAVLRTNLAFLREALDQFQDDTGGCLVDLEQLVADGYFRQLPADPYASEAGGWLAIRDGDGCILEVRSTSTATARDGSRYGDW